MYMKILSPLKIIIAMMLVMVSASSAFGISRVQAPQHTGVFASALDYKASVMNAKVLKKETFIQTSQSLEVEIQMLINQSMMQIQDMLQEINEQIISTRQVLGQMQMPLENLQG